MAGIVQDQRYHDTQVAPALDDQTVLYRGPLGGTDRTNALGAARALLHLVNFDEPFGLSVVEALACGTPVIASRRGSMPELIDHGAIGFLVDSVDEAVAAIARIGEIDRAVSPRCGGCAVHRRPHGRPLSRAVPVDPGLRTEAALPAISRSALCPALPATRLTASRSPAQCPCAVWLNLGRDARRPF